MSSSVEKIKERLDIAEVLGGYIKLEKAGANFKAKCPFHNEKTPSFFISPDRGTYYCFGCGAKGDIFTFVQEFEGADFLSSLKMLAQRAGVTLEDVPRQNTGEKEKLLSILEEATQFFEENLVKDKKAQEYLQKRGLRDETIKNWRLGFAPKEWRLLYEFFKNKGVSEKDLEKVGLIKKIDPAKDSKGEGYYDVFRGRIIFPIFDQSGKVIAFSGRLFEEDPQAPKYLNSPETSLFNKSETLYGLHLAKTEIRKKDYSILVEGQVDILMCHQEGFANTVASSGTAFTQSHLEKLKRFSNRLMLAFDSDKAGFIAANKSAVLGLSLGMEVKVADLPTGSDPAELILNDLSKWKETLRNSKHLIDFYLDRVVSEVKDKRNLAKEVEKKVLPYLSLLQSSIEQSHFVSQISKKTGIREDAIWNDLRKMPRMDVNSEIDDQKRIQVESEKRRRDFVERRLIGGMFWQKGKTDGAVSSEEIESKAKDILGEEYFKSLVDRLKPEESELIFESEAYYSNDEAFSRDLSELYLNLEEDVLKESFTNHMNLLQEAEREKNEKKAEELLKMCQEISKKLLNLSKKRREVIN